MSSEQRAELQALADCYRRTPLIDADSRFHDLESFVDSLLAQRTEDCATTLENMYDSNKDGSAAWYAGVLQAISTLREKGWDKS